MEQPPKRDAGNRTRATRAVALKRMQPRARRMALRATSGPELSTRSARPGDVVTIRAKVENTAAAPANVALFAEDLKEGVMAFDPPAASVPAKARKAMEFAWRAALPEGKDAHTWRGKLVLRDAESGRLVGEAALDVYVSNR